MWNSAGEVRHHGAGRWAGGALVQDKALLQAERQAGLPHGEAAVCTAVTWLDFDILNFRL